jgi:tetratricopeptide (TPR) repeat protein
MKHTKEQQLEDESRQAFRNLVTPLGWIVRDKNPDKGIDLEVEIVEGEDVTNKVLWVQVKATETLPSNKDVISHQMETKHLKYYEGCKLPVMIIFGIKKSDLCFDFYYLFAQKYIKEIIDKYDPEWREKGSKVVKFETPLRVEDLNDIATAGYFYIIQQQPTPTGALYWLDGIPKSDDKEIKERTLRALMYMWMDKYPAAIEEFDKILKVCVLSPTERMSILLNLGNAHRFLSQLEPALKNYNTMLEITNKVSEKDALVGKANALGGIGIVYFDKGELETSLEYHQKALAIDREIGFRQQEGFDLGNIGLIYRAMGNLDAALTCDKDALTIERQTGCRRGEGFALGNIGLIYSDKGDLDTALQYFMDALKIHREIGFKQGEASTLGNIGLVYSEKGDLKNALTCLKDALKINKEIGYRQGEANLLCNIGLIYRAKDDMDNAMTNLLDALKIFVEIGHKQGESAALGNIGLTYRAKGELDNALASHQQALEIARQIGYRKGEADDLGNIGLVYSEKGDLDKALIYLNDALTIHREVSYKQGEANGLGNIGLIYLDKGDLDTALKYLKEALEILDRFRLVYGRDNIVIAISEIESIKKKNKR